jgi:hypothetical protein
MIEIAMPALPAIKLSRDVFQALQGLAQERLADGQPRLSHDQVWGHLS